MEIKTAKFIVSSPKLSMCPKDNKPEYAFIGRSNVGKSTLINMLCNNKKLAKTSSTPGKTLLINHFLINDEWYIVDLPGYGYAKTTKSQKQIIEKMISSYILQRVQLTNVFVLIDIRHEMQTIDKEFIDWLGVSNIPFSIVFTKSDKLSVSKVKPCAEAWMDKLTDTWEELPTYFITSAKTSIGKDEITNYINDINMSIKQN
jgi:GTP-binding protein